MSRSQGAAPPSYSAIAARLSTLSARATHDARFLFAVVVGSHGDGQWLSGDDVDVRAVYALPTSVYLGIGSYWDEFEVIDESSSWTLDLVAFEVEKLARLVLKGHMPTLEWLRRPPLFVHPPLEDLPAQAATRLAELSGVSGQPGSATYGALDAMVCTARLLERGPRGG